MTTTALVVHESMLGHTATLAAAVARGLARTGLVVDVVDVTSPERLPHPAWTYDVLVVGAPTHRAERGLREWFSRLSECAPGHDRAAAFDTRVTAMRHLPGSAARKAGRVLRRHGYHLLDDPTSFHVADTDGPIVDGELARAEAWGAHLAAAARVARERVATAPRV